MKDMKRVQKPRGVLTNQQLRLNWLKLMLDCALLWIQSKAAFDKEIGVAKFLVPHERLFEGVLIWHYLFFYIHLYKTQRPLSE